MGPRCPSHEEIRRPPNGDADQPGQGQKASAKRTTPTIANPVPGVLGERGKIAGGREHLASPTIRIGQRIEQGSQRHPRLRAVTKSGAIAPIRDAVPNSPTAISARLNPTINRQNPTTASDGPLVALMTPVPSPHSRHHPCAVWAPGTGAAIAAARTAMPIEAASDQSRTGVPTRAADPTRAAARSLPHRPLDRVHGSGWPPSGGGRRRGRCTGRPERPRSEGRSARSPSGSGRASRSLNIAAGELDPRGGGPVSNSRASRTEAVDVAGRANLLAQELLRTHVQRRAKPRIGVAGRPPSPIGELARQRGGQAEVDQHRAAA